MRKTYLAHKFTRNFCRGLRYARAMELPRRSLFVTYYAREIRRFQFVASTLKSELSRSQIQIFTSELAVQVKMTGRCGWKRAWSTRPGCSNVQRSSKWSPVSRPRLPLRLPVTSAPSTRWTFAVPSNDAVTIAEPWFGSRV